MEEMDKDGGGTIDFDEFEAWWRANGGDLESKRDLAMTIVVEGGVQLLLVRGPYHIQAFGIAAQLVRCCSYSRIGYHTARRHRRLQMIWHRSNAGWRVSRQCLRMGSADSRSCFVPALRRFRRRKDGFLVFICK